MNRLSSSRSARRYTRAPFLLNVPDLGPGGMRMRTHVVETNGAALFARAGYDPTLEYCPAPGIAATILSITSGIHLKGRAWDLRPLSLAAILDWAGEPVWRGPACPPCAGLPLHRPIHGSATTAPPRRPGDFLGTTLDRELLGEALYGARGLSDTVFVTTSGRRDAVLFQGEDWFAFVMPMRVEEGDELARFDPSGALPGGRA